MTDAPPNLTGEDFPTLEGPINNNNININNSLNSSNDSSSSIRLQKFDSLQDSPITASLSSSSSHQVEGNNKQQQHTNTVTNSWSVSSQKLNLEQAKLNYILLNNSQQIYQQSQQQQVANQLVRPEQQPQGAMVSQYLQQQPQPQNNNNNNSSINNNTTNNNSTNHSNTMQNNPSIQQKRPGLPNPIVSSERCCTFKITPEERRHRDFELEQSKILMEIMQKTNTKIEVSTTKDGALNFCIIGKEAFLATAKNLVLNDFQTSVTLTVSVPKSIHGRLLGPKGQRLASIQDETQTKINIPRKDEDSDIIKITGLKNNAEQAVRSIQKYAREFAGKAVERVSVERIYLLFITGAFNENLKRWEEMGAKVSTSCGLLPSNNERESGYADELTFTIAGETTAVNQVKEEILHIYEDKKKKCTTVNMEVKKAQHKYILGPGGQNLRNLFAKTGVSVELPFENESETITLRGERSKLAPALSELYTQAHSETDEFLEVEIWLQKYLIGPRKTNFIDFKARGIDVKGLDDRIRLHGPPSEVENIRDLLEAELETIRKTIIKKDIRVEPRIHGYIIGKAGATVDQIREESGAYVVVPKNDEPSEFVTLEGTAEAVAIAEEKINAIAKKYEACRKLVIDQQLHGSIIGRGGEKIRSIREKFSQVVFTFPEQGSKNNEITILGPANEVEACYKYLDQFHQQLQENNHQAQVPIKADVVKYLTDAQQAIKRIKQDHRVKVDLFVNENNNRSNSKSASTKETKTPINESIATSVNIASDDATESASDPKKKSGKNKSGKKTNQQQQSNGITTNKSSEAEAISKSNSTNKGNSSNSESYAVVIGKKEDVDQAIVKVSKLFEELATTIELEVKVSNKLRSQIGPKTRLFRQLLDEFHQKIIITFPPNKQQQPQQTSGADKLPQEKSADKQTPTNNVVGGDEARANQKGSKVENSTGAGGESINNTNKRGNKSGTGQAQQQQSSAIIEVVKIRGPKSLAKKAEKRFEALVAECQDKMDKSYTAQVSVETAVIEKFLYTDKMKLNKIRESQNVKLNIPDRRETPQLQCVVVGYEKNVQDALQQFKKLVKEIEERTEETIEIPSQVHPRLIGAQGRAVKKIMEDFKVGVKFARVGDPNPNSVTLTGRADSILAAKNHMLKLADQYLSSASRMNAAGQQQQQQQQPSTQSGGSNTINNNSQQEPSTSEATASGGSAE